MAKVTQHVEEGGKTAWFNAFRQPKRLLAIVESRERGKTKLLGASYRKVEKCKWSWEVWDRIFKRRVTTSSSRMDLDEKRGKKKKNPS